MVCLKAWCRFHRHLFTYLILHHAFQIFGKLLACKFCFPVVLLQIRQSSDKQRDHHHPASNLWMSCSTVTWWLGDSYQDRMLSAHSVLQCRNCCWMIVHSVLWKVPCVGFSPQPQGGKYRFGFKPLVKDRSEKYFNGSLKGVRSIPQFFCHSLYKQWPVFNSH